MIAIGSPLRVAGHSFSIGHQRRLRHNQKGHFLSRVPIAIVACGMTCSALSIRPAHDNDAETVAAIYCPYVRDTAVSFELSLLRPRSWLSGYATRQ